MSLSSMTGFARAEGSHGAFTWAWELKSVNQRGLDVRLRMPPGLEALDGEVRKRVSAKMKRGAVQINLQMNRSEEGATLTINESVLTQVLQAMERLKGSVQAAPPTLDGLLSLRGILELSEPEETEEERAAREQALKKSFDAGLDALIAARKDEGKALKAILDDQLAKIETLQSQAEALSALQPEKIRKRLTDQISLLMSESSTPLPEERLAQEAALLMTKADVREELDRLTAHIQSGRDLMGSGEAVGRRLDFLTQEFNREVNTLCSKSPDIELTRIGLELKAVVDQFREQVQNVE